MKTIKLFVVALAAMTAISCAKEIAPEANENPERNPNLVEITLTATGENIDSDETAGNDTKAAFSGYPKIAWEGNEAISLLGTNTGNQRLTTTSKGYQATFTGYADKTDELYYAVYPYDENITLNTDGSLANVTVPAVQTATANQFDPNAYIAAAMSEDKENLSFKAIGAFIKLSFVNFSNVKSVTLVSNEGHTMAGTSNKTTVTTTGTSHADVTLQTASNSVRLQGSFDTSKPYFIIVRPHTYEGGITVYVELEDGTVLSRKGTSALFENGKSRNYIRPVTLNATNFSKVTDIYSLYTLGYDIKVGGKTYNKSTHSATLVTATEANTSLYTQINTGGLYFLATSGEGSFYLHSNVAVTKDVILIGNTEGTKVNIDFYGKNIYHTAATLALKNIEINAENNSNYLISNNNATADAEAFILDDCSVIGLYKPLWYASKENTCKIITAVDTDFQLTNTATSGQPTYGTANIIDLAKVSSTSTESITVNNCIFYNNNNAVARIINNSSNLSSYAASVVFTNNSIYNLHAGTNNGLLNIYGANDITFKNNLVSFYSLSSNEYIIFVSKNTPKYTVDNNHFWYRSSTGQRDDLTLYGSIMVEYASTNIFTTNAYPFNSTVAGAGATR